MSQVKAKQLKLNAAGDILIGGTNGAGTVLPIGNNNQVLGVSNGTLTWTDFSADRIISSNEKTSVVASENDVTVTVNDKVVTVFEIAESADSNLEIIADAGHVTLAAVGAGDDVDLILSAKGEGDVVIGASGSGTIQADDGYDLTILGGAGAGNLFLNGGGTGKVYYAEDATDPSKELATIGDIAEAVGGVSVPAQGRVEVAGDAVITLPAGVIAESVIVNINGLTIKDDYYSINSETKVLTFSGLPYALDSADEVLVTFDAVA